MFTCPSEHDYPSEHAYKKDHEKRLGQMRLGQMRDAVKTYEKQNLAVKNILFEYEKHVKYQSLNKMTLAEIREYVCKEESDKKLQLIYNKKCIIASLENYLKIVDFEVNKDLVDIKSKINQLEIVRDQVDHELGQNSDNINIRLEYLHESKEKLESEIVSAVKYYLTLHDPLFIY